ncbi:MAG: FAD-dependent oxidoreductase [Chlamydiales bacterium]|nr:FAD-dependent oxidoreductase [Chlamydiales bacterium]
MRTILLLGWALFAFHPKIEAVELTEKVVILGSGPAGLSAAIFAGREGLCPLVIDKYEVGSPIFKMTYLIENYPGFPKGIESTSLFGNMLNQAAKSGARFIYGLATSVDLSKRPFRIIVDHERQIFCETLIIATGEAPLKIEGQEKLQGKGVTGFEDVTPSDYTGKDVVILGAGDSALLTALIIAPEANQVAIVHLEEKPAAAESLLKKAERYPNICFIPNSTIREFHTGDDERLASIELFNPLTERKTTMPAQEVIVAIGEIANSKLFKGKLKMDSEGYILTDGHSTMTSTPGVFAAGDVSDKRYRKIITSAGSGAMAGIDAGRFLHGVETILIDQSPSKEP